MKPFVTAFIWSNLLHMLTTTEHFCYRAAGIQYTHFCAKNVYVINKVRKHGRKSRWGGSWDEPLEFGVGDANTNCAPDFPKSTVHNSPKHAISSEKFISFWGGDRAPTRPIPHGPHSTPPTKPSGSSSASRRIPAGFTPVQKNTAQLNHTTFISRPSARAHTHTHTHTDYHTDYAACTHTFCYILRHNKNKAKG